METLQYCVQARNKLAQLKTKPMPTRSKIMLIESLKQRLKEAHQYQMAHQSEKGKLDLNSTFFTQTKSLISKQEQETLIDQILKKQKLKIEMDQEIETCEDDLSEITKIVDTKIAYCEELGTRIANKSKQVEEEIGRKEKAAKLQKVKSTPSLFKKIFG